MNSSLHKLGSVAFLGLLVARLAHAEIALTQAQFDNLGIQTHPVVAASAGTEFAAIARVIDPLPWIKIDNDWQAATASTNAARAEAARTRELNKNGNGVSTHVMETAQAQLVAEETKLRSISAERQLLLGEALRRVDAAAWPPLLQDLASGRARLLRIEPAVITAKPAEVSGAAIRTVASDRTALQWLGVSAQAGNSASASYLGIAHDGSLAIGEVAAAVLFAPTPELSGQRVPASAVLRWQGRNWVYVSEAALHFERQDVSLLRRLDGGDWLVTGIEAGDVIATEGSAALLAADLGQGKETAPDEAE